MAKNLDLQLRHFLELQILYQTAVLKFYFGCLRGTFSSNALVKNSLLSLLPPSGTHTYTSAVLLGWCQWHCVKLLPPRSSDGCLLSLTAHVQGIFTSCRFDNLSFSWTDQYHFILIITIKVTSAIISYLDFHIRQSVGSMASYLLPSNAFSPMQPKISEIQIKSLINQNLRHCLKRPTLSTLIHFSGLICATSDRLGFFEKTNKSDRPSFSF